MRIQFEKTSKKVKAEKGVFTLPPKEPRPRGASSFQAAINNFSPMGSKASEGLLCFPGVTLGDISDKLPDWLDYILWLQSVSD